MEGHIRLLYINYPNPRFIPPRTFDIFYLKTQINRMCDFTTTTATNMILSAFTTSYVAMSDDELFALIPEDVKNQVLNDIKEMIEASGDVPVANIFIGKTGSCRGNDALAEYINRQIKKAGCAGGVLTQTEEGAAEAKNGNLAKEVVYDVATRFTGQVPFTHEINLTIGGGSSQKGVLGPELTSEQAATVAQKRAEALAEYNANHPDAPRTTTFEEVDIGIVKTANFADRLVEFEYYVADAVMLCQVLGLPEVRVVGLNAMGNTLKSSEKAVCTKGLTECPFTDSKPEQVAKLEAIWAIFNKLGVYAIVPNRKVDKAGASWCNQYVRDYYHIMVGWDYSSSQRVKYTKRFVEETNPVSGETKPVMVVERAIKPLSYVGDDKLIDMMTPKTEEVATA